MLINKLGSVNFDTDEIVGIPVLLKFNKKGGTKNTYFIPLKFIVRFLSLTKDGEPFSLNERMGRLWGNTRDGSISVDWYSPEAVATYYGISDYDAVIYINPYLRKIDGYDCINGNVLSEQELFIVLHNYLLKETDLCAFLGIKDMVETLLSKERNVYSSMSQDFKDVQKFEREARTLQIPRDMSESIKEKVGVSLSINDVKEQFILCSILASFGNVSVYGSPLFRDVAFNLFVKNAVLAYRAIKEVFWDNKGVKESLNCKAIVEFNTLVFYHIVCYAIASRIINLRGVDTVSRKSSFFIPKPYRYCGSRYYALANQENLYLCERLFGDMLFSTSELTKYFNNYSSCMGLLQCYLKLFAHGGGNIICDGKQIMFKDIICGLENHVNIM